MKSMLIREESLPEVSSDYMERFLAGQLSKQTRRAYAGDLRAFFEAMDVQNPWEVTSDQIIDYRNRIMKFDEENGELLNAATVSRKLSAIRSFYDFARAKRAVERNPADPRIVKSPKLEHIGRTKGLSNKEVRRLLEEPDRTTLRGKRDYAIL